MKEANDKDCKPNPCENGGKCVSPQGNNYYTCNCPTGFSGATCQTRIEITSSTASVINPTPSAWATAAIQPMPTTSIPSAIQSTSSTSIPSAIKHTSFTTTSSAIKHSTSTSTKFELQPTSPVFTASAIQPSPSTSTESAKKPSPSASTASVIKTSALTSTVPPNATTESAVSHTTQTRHTMQANQRLGGDKTTVVVSVIIPVVVVVICGVIVGVCLIRRWKRKKGLGTTALERAPGISILNTSYGDHQVHIPKAANRHVHDVTSNEYAEIVANGNPVNEKSDGYYTINDVPKISQTNNTNYAHVNTHKAVMLDSNYSHIENNNKKVSKTGDYGFSMFKRGIFQFKKSFKKEPDSSYDNLEMKTIAYNPNKTVKDVAVTEMESEYNQTQSGLHGTIKKDIQNEKDEYSHLDYKPKSMKEHANEVANENAYLRGQSTLTSELPKNVRANEYENEVDIGHDYFVLEAVGESGDDSVKESDITKFEERNSNNASGFQYDYAREVERSGTHTNEEKRDIRSAFHYELSKDIDKNSDIANKPDDVGDSLGTSSAKEDENQNHHYFILSKT